VKLKVKIPQEPYKLKGRAKSRSCLFYDLKAIAFSNNFLQANRNQHVTKHKKHLEFLLSVDLAWRAIHDLNV